MSGQPCTGLVLGAGSARGLAHIGVAQVLKENGISFDFMVGSSMGAMVAGIYACGADLYMLGKMSECMDANLFYDVHVPRLGFMSGRKIMEFLNLVTKKKTFDDLIWPVKMVATDLISGQRMVIDQGSVAEAIRASISIPGIFNPVKKEGMVLVDGAVSDRLPVEVARLQGAQVIIAVDVTFGEGRRVIIRNALDVVLTSLDILQKQQFDLIRPGADVVIQPEVGGFSPRDFDQAGKIIELGRRAAEAKIQEIKTKLENA
ncbi:MAG TPA: patatin-like phospholipase family protein [Syntrophomonadaceae bacterium]|nr:patatin-like phospholipase family protein [Syntrophomonadaceae bacterium]